MKMKLLSVAASLAFLSVASPASADLIVNGSFEFGVNDSPGPNTFVTIPGPSGAIINNWTVGGSVDWINGYWVAQDGTHSVDLNGVSLGSVQQTISTVTGQPYVLTFYISGNPDQGSDTKTLLASAGGASANYSYTFTVGPNDLSHMGWELRTLGFTATGPTTLISFVSTSSFFAGSDRPNCCWGPALDNVAVSPVPEISTWAMMILGFAGIALVAYRRTKKRAAVIAVA